MKFKPVVRFAVMSLLLRPPMTMTVTMSSGDIAILVTKIIPIGFVRLIMSIIQIMFVSIVNCMITADINILLDIRVLIAILKTLQRNMLLIVQISTPVTVINESEVRKYENKKA